MDEIKMEGRHIIEFHIADTSDRV